jgi:hypothetical protein
MLILKDGKDRGKEAKISRWEPPDSASFESFSEKNPFYPLFSFPGAGFLICHYL